MLNYDGINNCKGPGHFVNKHKLPDMVIGEAIYVHQKPIPLVFEDVYMAYGFHCDLILESNCCLINFNIILLED